MGNYSNNYLNNNNSHSKEKKVSAEKYMKNFNKSQFQNYNNINTQNNYNKANRNFGINRYFKSTDKKVFKINKNRKLTLQNLRKTILG